MQHLIHRLAAARRVIVRYEWLGPLAVRLAFGYFWAETGYAKLMNLDGFTERFVGWGIPWPAFSAAVSAWTELVGGVAIMLGLATRLVALPLAFNMVVAIALVVGKNVHGLDELVELDEFVYILLFFWLFTAGPGRASLDAWLWPRLAGNAMRGGL
ncbi:MAG: DoxX family protein [Gammaproteobacteria bacterium]|nr:DoxX family protein [Gammaproteobacteria bacterium]